MKEKISVIRKAPGKAPERIEIPNELEALQWEVGGYIETVTIPGVGVVICDEEGRLKGKTPNCQINLYGFVGVILIAGVDGEEFTDAPDGAEKVIKYRVD